MPEKSKIEDSFVKLQEVGSGNYFDVFPDDPVLTNHLQDSFVINRPKSQGVGGDGFWTYEKEGTIYIAIFDCMGHGHLASMMTRIYRNALEKVIVNADIEYTGSILQFIHREIQSKFEGKNQKQITTGADFGIVRINRENKQIEFAGAKIDLINVSEGKAKVIKGDRMQVGEMFEYRHQYNSNNIDLEDEVSCFYLTTDGAKNVIGGTEDRKIGSSDLKRLLESISLYTMNEQKLKIDQYLEKWRGKNEPADDVLMVGFKA